MPKTIEDVQKESYEVAASKGWWDEGHQKSFLEALFLIMSEATEAGEEYRNGHRYTDIYYVKDQDGYLKPEGIPIELADVLIRLGDTCEFFGVDLAQAYEAKMAYNRTRPYRHGNKKA